MGKFTSKVHPAISAYFGSDDCALWESFKQGRGWLREAPRLSLTRLRQLRAQGVTMIAVKCGERIADFAIAEVTNAPQTIDLAPAQRAVEYVAGQDATPEPQGGPLILCDMSAGKRYTFDGINYIDDAGKPAPVGAELISRDAYIGGSPAYQSSGARRMRAITWDACAAGRGSPAIIAQEAPARELAAPAQGAPELMTAIPHAELTALLHFAQSASVLSAAIKEVIPPAPEWGVTLTPTRAAMLRATAELIETRGDVAILQALRALGVTGVVDDYSSAIKTAQGEADAAHAASNAAIDAHYSAPGPQYTPRALTMANLLTGARSWAVTMRENHAHYGIESLIAGIDAVQARPSRLRLDADGAAFLPSMPIEK